MCAGGQLRVSRVCALSCPAISFLTFLPIVHEKLMVNVRLVLVQTWGILGLERDKKKEDSLHVLWINSHYFLEKKNITFCVIGFSNFWVPLVTFQILEKLAGRRGPLPRTQTWRS